MANSNVHAETGAATIVDRVEGWGHTDSTDANREDNDTWGSASGNTVTATQASKESTANRVARSLKARKTFTEATDPAIVDRTIGYGGDFDPTGSADDGYGHENLEDETPVSLADADDYKNGVFYDEDDVEEAGTGANTAQTTSDTHALATGRTADSRDTVLLNDDDDASRAESARTSIRDRSSGWGHTAGTFSYRND
jgi:hypothetical protein